MAPPNPETMRSPSPMLRLPHEIVKIIVDQVPNSTIKNLRLTCRFYAETVDLRLDRVFISANPRNIEVFTAIANHMAFRAKITEIIWDDALLYVKPKRGYKFEDDYNSMDEDDEIDEYGIHWRGSVPEWFRAACRGNIYFLMGNRVFDVDRPIHVAREQEASEQMPMEGAWAYYQELLQQQRNVLDSKAHIYALEKYIGSFPALKRIVITPATHGWLYNPLYQTPMIRAFPHGFNHYIPRGWPITDGFEPECNEWDDEGNDWQGFRVVSRLLAEGRDFGRVIDLRVDVKELEMGLNSRVFEMENRTLSDFEAVLARPNFMHLQLDLMADPHGRQSDVFRRGLLKRALDGAAGGQGLEYLSFRTNLGLDSWNRDLWYVPLTTIFTPTIYSRLQHFGLARFCVKQDDLLALLASMPKTLRSVELSMLEFIDGEGSHRTMLSGMRDKLGWKERDPRPTLTINTHIQNPNPGRSIWMEDELYSFLYHDGINPFEDNPAPNTSIPTYIGYGFGWEKDCFDPSHERPNVDYYDLADMGYIEDMGTRPVPRPSPEPL